MISIYFPEHSQPSLALSLSPPSPSRLLLCLKRNADGPPGLFIPLDRDPKKAFVLLSETLEQIKTHPVSLLARETRKSVKASVTLQATKTQCSAMCREGKHPLPLSPDSSITGAMKLALNEVRVHRRRNIRRGLTRATEAAMFRFMEEQRCNTLDPDSPGIPLAPSAPARPCRDQS